MASTLKIFEQLGEPALRPIGEIAADMEAIDGILQKTTNNSILNLTQCNQKVFVAVMKVRFY